MTVRFSNAEMEKERCTDDYLPHQEFLSQTQTSFSYSLSIPFHCETWLLYLSHQHRVMINMFSLIPHLPHIFLLYLILSYLILLYLIIAKPGLSVASRSGISPLLTCSRAGRPSQKGLRLQMIRKLY